MEELKTTRREVLTAAIALAVPAAVFAEAGSARPLPPAVAPVVTETPAAPVLYRRSHCRGGWTLVSGTL